MRSPFKYLIRKRALGDVLWIEPVIAGLAKRTGKLVVHTRYNELFKNYPLANVVFKDRLTFIEKILVRISFLPFIKQMVVSLDNSYEVAPKQHFLHAYQQKAGLPITDIYPSLYLSADEKGQFLSLKTQCQYVVIHRENSQLKNIRKVYGVNWESVVSHILGQGFKVYQLGGKETQIPGAEFMETSIREMIALLYHASFFIGVDSGPSHIAAALKVPSIILFTVINPDFRHFRSLFRGIILKQVCCLDGGSHDFESLKESACKVVEAGEVPPCCLYTTGQIINSVNKLIVEYIA